MMDILESPQTLIQECFAGAVIFITGGTGFLGKILIEKLLWSFPDIKKIYILVRSKKNKRPEERLEKIFDSKVFVRVEKVKPNFREFISIVYGDFEKAGLGLSEEQRNMIISEVNIVFHTAATVKFDEKIRLAAQINIQGTKYMIELCKQINNLKVFIHVSTAYSHCTRKDIYEQFYECPRDPEEFLEYIHKKTDEELDALTPEILGEWPNTYSFTKCIAEEIVRKSIKDLPIVMCRPSIVSGSWREPHEGWIDNINGPTALVVGVAYGVIRVIACNQKSVTNIVPVDMVVNHMIAAAWDKSTHKYNSDDIFHCVASQRNPLTWRQFSETSYAFAHILPVPDSLWYPTVHFVTTKMTILLYTIIFHYMPGMLIDVLLRIKGDKPKMMHIYKRYDKVVEMLRYFGCKDWNFFDTNTQTLWKKMTDRDQEIFPFNIEAIKWDDYLYNLCKEIRLTVLKHPESTIVRAKERNNRLKILHESLLYIFWIVIFYFIYKKFF